MQRKFIQFNIVCPLPPTPFLTLVKITFHTSGWVGPFSGHIIFIVDYGPLCSIIQRYFMWQWYQLKRVTTLTCNFHVLKKTEMLVGMLIISYQPGQVPDWRIGQVKTCRVRTKFWRLFLFPRWRCLVWCVQWIQWTRLSPAAPPALPAV